MKKGHPLLIDLLIVCLIAACTRTNSSAPVVPSLPSSIRPVLSPFEVTVLNRAPNSAGISWTASSNHTTSDTVKYKIVLNGITVDSNLLKLTDTLLHLIADSVYTGRVFAYTSPKDTISAPFTLDRVDGYVFFGDNGNMFNGYDPFTGVRLWNTLFPQNTITYPMVPVISHDTVFAYNPSGGLWSFNAKTGIVIWGGNAPYLPQNDYLNGGPTYDNGTLYASLYSGVYAVESATGRPRWHYTPTGMSGLNYTVTFPVTAGGKVFVGGNDGAHYMAALNTADGTVAWRFPLTSQISPGPVLVNNTVIFGTYEAKFYALDQSTGQQVWMRDLSAAYNNLDGALPPVVAGNLVIVFHGNEGLYALDSKTGSTVWLNKDMQGVVLSSPAAGNGMVYCSSLTGSSDYKSRLFALNANTGQLVWSTMSTSSSLGNFVLVNDRLYMRGYSGIVIYDALKGSYINSYSFFNGAGSFCMQVKGQNYYPSESGMVQ